MELFIIEERKFDMSKEHTPTPWRVDDTKIEHCCIQSAIIKDVPQGDGMYSQDYMLVAECYDAEEAAHIVKCVNMHDELVEALDAIGNLTRATVLRDTAGSAVNRLNMAIDMARATLKKAGAL